MATRPNIALRFLRGFTAMDRRWTFLAMAVVIVLPLLFPIGLPITPQPQVRAVYDAIDQLPQGSRIIISADYGPGSKPEIQPFIEALFDLCFRKGIRVVSMSLWPQAPPLVDAAFRRVGVDKYQRVYGVDFVNLGFKEGKIVVMQKVGESITNTFSTDSRGTRLDALPIMKGVTRLGDFPFLLCLSAGYPGCYEWVPQVQGRFIDRIAAATTSVVAPDLIPFIGSGQLFGMVAGMSGAAQFEQLAGLNGAGTRGMDAQSFAHLLIIAAIIIANIAYFVSPEFRRRRRS